MKDTLGKEFYESVDKTITIKRQQTAVEFAVEQLEQLIPSGHQLAIRIILDQAKEMEKQQQVYSAKDMINFVEFVSQYYADDSMENSSIYELLEKFKTK